MTKSLWRVPAAAALCAWTALSGGATCLGIDQINNTIKDSVAETAALLDQATRDINNNLSGWQGTLQDLESKLASDTQSTVRNEVQDLLTNSIAVANSSVQCDVDFIGHRVVQGLARIKAEVLKQPVPPPQPAACSATPSGVEMDLWKNGRVPKIDLYGYDFDGPMAVKLVSTNGTVDVSTALSKTSHYQATINLGGNGVPLSSTSQRIDVVSGAEEVSSLPIIQPVTPPCKEMTDTFSGEPITFTPPRVNGDSDFDGNGPNVNIRLSLSPAGDGVNWLLYFDARETQSDWTEVEGQKSGVFYTPPPGWRVENIAQTFSSDSYTDTNHNLDVRRPGSGPVDRFEATGDTDGDDVGRAGVVVYFHPVAIQRIEKNNCVPPSTLRRMKARNELSPESAERFKAVIGP